MRYYPRLNVYKNHNSTNHYNPETKTATSYDWWYYFKPIKDKLVFNNYNYSNTTLKHQYQLKKILQQLDIQPDLYLECPKGLQDLNSGIAYYQNKIDDLTDLINKPRTHKKKNVERRKQIETYKTLIYHIKRLLK